uniref:Uncharacterized protein n=1 Tax=Candidatus Kentrum sp. MB TaxID=2138164 RepID=A0A450XS46_9GAMM|nr:MAG: hypothetical protein BECKMB1821G_GA0114241_110210 [Candidatus Kentron sp. MB]
MQFSSEYKDKVKFFLRRLNKQFDSIKALDKKIPLVVLFVNWSEKNGTKTLMFIEYPTLHGNTVGKSTYGYQVRPFVRVAPQQRGSFYKGFYDSFEKLWKDETKPLEDLEWINKPLDS